MKQIEVEVITPERAAYKTQANSVTVPGTNGSFQVLYNHAAVISSLDVGPVKIVEADGKEVIFAAGGGTIEVLNNKVLILAESFEDPSKIDVERAELAKERAEERLKRFAQSDVDEVRAEMALKRAINRIRLAGKI